MKEAIRRRSQNSFTEDLVASDFAILLGRLWEGGREGGAARVS